MRAAAATSLPSVITEARPDPGPMLADTTAVDLGLVLAVDCSSSVDAADFRMQMDGIAAALRDRTVHDAIISGWHRRIALALVQWSDRKTQAMTLPWRILGTPQQIEGAARAIEKAERQWQPGGTGLAAAVDYCTALLQALPIVAERRVIDVSGDGMDNDGGGTEAARSRALALGITINGLPIVSGSPYIVAYYRDRVIGGAGSFLVPAEDMRSFRNAMLRKLLREIGRPVA